MEMLSGIAQSPVQPAASAPAAKPAPESPSAPPKAERPSRDEYLPEEPHVPSGMYRPGKAEEGKPEIDFDDPEKGGRCTINTDKVDAEIKALKEKRERLEARLAKAQDDPKKQEQLRRQLDQVTEELRCKDNDTYRRQNARVTGA